MVWISPNRDMKSVLNRIIHLCACLTSLVLLLILSAHLDLPGLLSGLLNCNSWTVGCAVFFGQQGDGRR